jgi:hypothetical protein
MSPEATPAGMKMATLVVPDQSILRQLCRPDSHCISRFNPESKARGGPELGVQECLEVMAEGGKSGFKPLSFQVLVLPVKL